LQHQKTSARTTTKIMMSCVLSVSDYMPSDDSSKSSVGMVLRKQPKEHVVQVDRNKKAKVGENQEKS
jgi:hypothetical protein